MPERALRPSHRERVGRLLGEFDGGVERLLRAQPVADQLADLAGLPQHVAGICCIRQREEPIEPRDRRLVRIGGSCGVGRLAEIGALLVDRPALAEVVGEQVDVPFQLVRVRRFEHPADLLVQILPVRDRKGPVSDVANERVPESVFAVHDVS